MHHLLVLRLRHLSNITERLASPGYQAGCWQSRYKDSRIGPQGPQRGPSELRHSPVPNTSICCCKVLANCNFVISYFFRSFSVTPDLVVAGHFTTVILLVAVVNKPDCAYLTRNTDQPSDQKLTAVNCTGKDEIFGSLCIDMIRTRRNLGWCFWLENIDQAMQQSGGC